MLEFNKGDKVSIKNTVLVGVVVAARMEGEETKPVIIYRVAYNDTEGKLQERYWPGSELKKVEEPKKEEETK